MAGGAGFLAGLLAQPVTATFVRRVRHAVANASFASLAPGAKTLDVLKALFGRRDA